MLIKVAAAGVNRPDVMQRVGLYPAPKGHSEIPGLEVSGTVALAAPEAHRFKTGDKVMALVNGGGYAEYCLADEGSCLPVPDGVSMVEAAAIPESFFTVWHNVFERGGLKPGEWFLMHGGTSGIGVAAIQLAAANGAKVIATAGSPEKCETCRRARGHARRRLQDRGLRRGRENGNPRARRRRHSRHRRAPTTSSATFARSPTTGGSSTSPTSRARR